MATDDQPTRPQVFRTNLAKNLTSEQIQWIDDLLRELGAPATPANKLAMLQILATNYLAETTRKKT